MIGGIGPLGGGLCPGWRWMGGIIGTIGNQMPPPGEPGVSGGAAGKIGTTGVNSSGAGGSVGASTGNSGNLYAKTGTSTGGSSNFSAGSCGRIGSIGTAE